MAISGYETYVPTMGLFQTHWTATNFNRATPLVLKDGSTIATLVALTNLVEDKVSNANFQSDAEATAAKSYADYRQALYNRMSQFRRLADYLVKGKDYAGKILPLPRKSRDDGDLFKVADSVVYGWEKANEDVDLPPASLPLTLDGGYGVTQFVSDLNQLRAIQKSIGDAANAADTARKSRDVACFQARNLLKEYRAAILAFYAPDSVEVSTLPKIFLVTKPSPDAPKLKVDYVAGQSKATLTWVIAPDVTLSRFYVKMSPGARYNDKNAVRLADLDDLQRAYETLEGTIGLGATVWFKVIAVDDDAKETGSNAVKVVRAS